MIKLSNVIVIFPTVLFSVFAAFGQDNTPEAKSPAGSTIPQFSNAPSQSNATLDKGALSKGDITPQNGYLGFSEDLLTLSAGNNFNMQIGIEYSNMGVYNQVRQDNRVAPTGILGLGWSFAIEQIYVNHNGTKDTADDKWFYQDDMGSVHAMEYGANKVLYIKGLLNYKVISKKNTAGGDLIVGWEIIKPDGTKMFFGDYDRIKNGGVINDNALGVTFSSAGVVGLFNASSEEFYDRWFVALKEHYDGIHYFTYEYKNHETPDPVNETITGEPLGNNGTSIGSLLATKAVFLKQIKSSTGDYVDFEYGFKDPSEYADPTPFTTEPDYSIDPCEKLFLSAVELHLNSSAAYFRRYAFGYNNSSTDFINISKNGTAILIYNKRILQNICIKGTDGNNLQPPMELTYEQTITGSTPVPGFGSLKSIKSSSGLVTEYSYSKLDNVYPIYQDNNTQDEGNLSNIGTGTNQLPSTLDPRSQFISGAGFLVVNEKISDGTWKPYFYAQIDSGFRPVTSYLPSVGEPINWPASLTRQSRIQAFGDRLVIMVDTFTADQSTPPKYVEKYNAYVFRFSNNQFHLEWSRTGAYNGLYIGSDLQISGNMMLRSWSEDGIKKVRAYLFDPSSSAPWESKQVFSNDNEKVSAQCYLTNNAVFIKRGLNVSYMVLEKQGSLPKLHAEIQLSLPSGYGFGGIYDFQFCSDKVAVKTKSSNSGFQDKWTYVFYQFDGTYYLPVKQLSDYADILTAGNGYLGSRGKMFLNDNWVGVYEDMDYGSSPIKRLCFFNWAGNQKCYIPFDANWNGFYMGGGFLSYNKSYADYGFYFKYASIGAGMVNSNGSIQESYSTNANDVLGGAPTKAKYSTWIDYVGSNLMVNVTEETNSNQYSGRHTLGSGETPDANSGHCQFIDINGDGLLDFVFQNHSGDNYWYVRYNNGDDTWSGRHTLGNGETPDVDNNHCQFVDINGDGLLDFVFQNHYSGDDCWYARYNQGDDTWSGRHTLGNCETPDAATGHCQFIDINRDGLPDFVFQNHSGDNYWYVRYNASIKEMRPFLAIDNNNLFNNFSVEMISTVDVKQSGVVQSQTALKYRDPNPGSFSGNWFSGYTYHANDDEETPNAFEWYEDIIKVRYSLLGGECEYPMPVENYFILDHTTNTPRNIKNCAIANSGAYTISYQYGSDLMRASGTGLEDPAVYPMADLEGQPYQINTYNANNQLISRTINYWEAHSEPNNWPFGFVEPRLLKTEQSNYQIKTVDEFDYDGKGLPTENRKIMPDGKKIVTQTMYMYNYESQGDFADSNILTAPFNIYRFIDKNNDGHRQTGECLLSDITTYWQNTDGFWKPAMVSSPYYTDPENQNVNLPDYSINAILTIDGNDNVISSSAGKEGVALGRKTSGVIYNIDGTLPLVAISNTENANIITGLFDEISQPNGNSEGWQGFGDLTVKNDGIYSIDPTTISRTQNLGGLANYIVEFDAYCDDATSSGIIQIRNLNGSTTVSTETFNVPKLSSVSGQLQHFIRKLDQPLYRIYLDLPSHTFVDNLIFYPDTAAVTINHYDHQTRQLLSTISNSKHAYQLYDIDGSLLNHADDKGQINNWGHTYFSRELSGTDNYDGSMPNMSEKVSFINGNLIPYWSFEGVGDVAINHEQNNVLPHWEPYWYATLDTTVRNHHFYGQKSLGVTPASFSAEINSPLSA